MRPAVVRGESNLPGDPINGGVVGLELGKPQNNGLDRRGVDKKGDVLCVAVIKGHLDGSLLVGDLPSRLPIQR